ncbi:hypothetical protein BpHYR1_001589 [Brachionus plicatilis]|uniref:Uncharacterized protein n=1 Tax=Brachionus plicatilis TaxID=10195 RepID=A0A3M7QJW9_BRAPC|nr:hypothetical protein BpHYR1_001589 [Brachionus plicatilis]
MITVAFLPFEIPKQSPIIKPEINPISKRPSKSPKQNFKALISYLGTDGFSIQALLIAIVKHQLQKLCIKPFHKIDEKILKIFILILYRKLTTINHFGKFYLNLVNDFNFSSFEFLDP